MFLIQPIEIGYFFISGYVKPKPSSSMKFPMTIISAVNVLHDRIHKYSPANQYSL